MVNMFSIHKVKHCCIIKKKNTSKYTPSGYTERMIYNMKVTVQEYSTGTSPAESHYTNHGVELDYKWLVIALK